MSGRISEDIGNFPVLMDCHNCMYGALASQHMKLRHHLRTGLTMSGIRDAQTCWESNEILLLMEDQNLGKTSVLAKTVAQLYSSEEPTGVVGYTQEVALGFPGGLDKFRRHCSR
jgi:hypothetical protein